MNWEGNKELLLIFNWIPFPINKKYYELWSEFENRQLFFSIYKEICVIVIYCCVFFVVSCSQSWIIQTVFHSIIRTYVVSELIIIDSLAHHVIINFRCKFIVVTWLHNDWQHLWGIKFVIFIEFFKWMVVVSGRNI